MKIRLTSKISLLLLLAVFVSACDKDDGNNGGGPGIVGNNYFNCADGSKWIYENYTVDKEKNFSLMSKYDTLSQQKDTVLLGQKAKWMRHHFLFNLLNIENTMSYGMYQAGSKLFVSSNYLTMFVPEMLKDFVSITEDSWFKLVDGSAGASQPWTMDSTKLSGLEWEIPSAGVTIQLTGFTKITAERASDTTFFEHSNVHCYRIKVFFDGTATSPSPGVAALLTLAGQLRANFTEINLYLKEGTGIVGIYALPAEPSVYAVSNPNLVNYKLEDLSFDGFAKNLLHFEQVKAE